MQSFKQRWTLMVFVIFHQWICAMGLAFPVRGGMFHTQPFLFQWMLLFATQCSFPKAARFSDGSASSANFPQRNISFIESSHPLHLALRWVSVSQRQRIHIITSLTIDPGPITRSLRCCYVGLLTFFFFYWHFHFALLNNWVTGACHGAQKSKRERAGWKLSQAVRT